VTAPLPEDTLLLTGRGWWNATFMTAATGWFVILSVRELRRFRRDSGGTAKP